MLAGRQSRGDPLLCIVSEQVSEEYLETQRTAGISWIAVGAERIDLSQAMELLHEHFDIKRLAIVGGRHICGSFLEAGLINEVSIMVAKVSQSPEFFFQHLSNRSRR